MCGQLGGKLFEPKSSSENGLNAIGQWRWIGVKFDNGRYVLFIFGVFNISQKILENRKARPLSRL